MQGIHSYAIHRKSFQYGKRKASCQTYFGLLPAEQARELLAVWEEFEEGQTPEAKLAKAMDRFEPLLQTSSNNGGTWNEPGVTYTKVYTKKSAIKDGAESIWGYELLINDGVEKGILKRG